MLVHGASLQKMLILKSTIIKIQLPGESVPAEDRPDIGHIPETVLPEAPSIGQYPHA
jgi:hypothetical protein